MWPPTSVILHRAGLSSVHVRTKIVNEFLDMTDNSTFDRFESRFGEHLVLDAALEAMHTFIDRTDGVRSVFTVFARTACICSFAEGELKDRELGPTRTVSPA
jgi:hypothetical protein